MARQWKVLSLALVLGGACTGSDPDTGDVTDTDTGEQQQEQFDPDDPGIHMFLTLGAATMMGQPIELAIAGFLPTAREDFDGEDEGEIPLDTCVVVEGTDPVPECDGPEDCAPEQECVPDYDDGGQPISGTEHCSTPRDPIDMGPFTLTGANGGPMQMGYNAGQSGAYTKPGTDGSLPAGTLAFDVDYTFEGAGDAAKGLGAYSGEVFMPAQLGITTPPMTDIGMGMMGIQVSATSALDLQWTGSNPGGEVVLALAGASIGGESGSIECRVSDDGAFTIPADMVVASHLGGFALLNVLTVERASTGQASGEGMTIDLIDTTQTLILNVATGS